MGFIVILSCMYTMYFDHIHPPYSLLYLSIPSPAGKISKDKLSMQGRWPRLDPGLDVRI
jgi:hypothetical protein